MPDRYPPADGFYDDPANFELRRAETQLYEDFATVEEIPEKQKAFVTVLYDVLGRMGELPEPVESEGASGKKF